MNDCSTKDIHQLLFKPVCACMARSKTEGGVPFIFFIEGWYSRHFIAFMFIKLPLRSNYLILICQVFLLITNYQPCNAPETLLCSCFSVFLLLKIIAVISKCLEPNSNNLSVEMLKTFCNIHRTSLVCVGVKQSLL